MHHPTAADPSLEGRLAELERQQRRMRWVSLALLLALVGSCARKAEVPAEIVAREFKVVDEQGNVYASLGISLLQPAGTLMLRDLSDERRRALLGPAELLLDGRESAAQLEVDRDALFTMRDRHDWTGAKLSVHPDSHKSSLWLSNGKESIYRNP
jgi:hypothetical protein